MAARLSALRADRTLRPRFLYFKDSWYSFLLEAKLTPGPVRPEGLGQFKKSTSSGLEPAHVRKKSTSSFAHQRINCETVMLSGMFAGSECLLNARFKSFGLV
jgi:hypothetical protein